MDGGLFPRRPVRSRGAATAGQIVRRHDAAAVRARYEEPLYRGLPAGPQVEPHVSPHPLPPTKAAQFPRIGIMVARIIALEEHFWTPQLVALRRAEDRLNP